MSRGLFDGRRGGNSRFVILLGAIVLVLIGVFIFKQPGIQAKVIGGGFVIAGITGFFRG